MVAGGGGRSTFGAIRFARGELLIFSSTFLGGEVSLGRFDEGSFGGRSSISGRDNERERLDSGGCSEESELEAGTRPFVLLDDASSCCLISFSSPSPGVKYLSSFFFNIAGALCTQRGVRKIQK